MIKKISIIIISLIYSGSLLAQGISHTGKVKEISLPIDVTNLNVAPGVIYTYTKVFIEGLVTANDCFTNTTSTGETMVELTISDDARGKVQAAALIAAKLNNSLVNIRIYETTAGVPGFLPDCRIEYVTIL